MNAPFKRGDWVRYSPQYLWNKHRELGRGPASRARGVVIEIRCINEVQCPGVFMTVVAWGPDYPSEGLFEEILAANLRKVESVTVDGKTVEIT